MPLNYGYFGYSVSLSGETVAIGAPQGTNTTGQAYIFVRNGRAWSQQALISPPYDRFGEQLSLNGDTVAIQASGNSLPSAVYVRNGATWSLQQRFPSGGFALSGNTLVVSDQGAAAAVYTRSGASWTEQQLLVSSDVFLTDGFSGFVAIDGGTILVSASNKTIGVNQGQGAVYVFTAQTNVALAAVSVGPNVGSGAGVYQTFTALYTDPKGASDVQVVYLDFGPSIFAPHSCIAVYVPGPNVMYLYNDTNTAVVGSFTVGNGGNLSNSQCNLSDGGAVVREGTNVSISFRLNFSGAFHGTQNIWGLAQSYNGAQSPWQLLGSWTLPPTPPPPPPAAVSVTPANGGGVGPQTFKALYSDPNGFSDLQVTYLDFGQSIFSANSCIISYVQATNQLFLYNDAATGRVPGSITAGGSGTLSNSQCAISGNGGAATGSGNNLTVPVSISFQPAFHGSQNLWGLAQNYSGVQSGWQSFGTWVTGLAAVSVSPNSGGGLGPQTFNALYIDPKNGTDLQAVYLDFGNSLFAANSCIVAYVQASNALYLFNDASNSALGPITEGSGGTLSNSQCTVSGNGGSVIVGGFNLTVPFSITFTGTFTGSKNIWGLAQSYSGAQSGWQTLGTWTP